MTDPIPKTLLHVVCFYAKVMEVTSYYTNDHLNPRKNGRMCM